MIRLAFYLFIAFQIVPDQPSWGDGWLRWAVNVLLLVAALAWVTTPDAPAPKPEKVEAGMMEAVVDQMITAGQFAFLNRDGKLTPLKTEQCADAPAFLASRNYRAGERVRWNRFDGSQL